MNMNKKLVSAAVLAGIASSASALSVNGDGIGELLFFPYYTVADGSATNISIVNTTANTVAVKVRFNEGVNSWEVKDFNLYLSPYDVWVGGVALLNDTPIIHSPDTSCTVPEVHSYAEAAADATIEANQQFSAINFSNDPAGLTNGVTAANRIREGYIEVIEMGVVTEDIAAPWGSSIHDLWDGIDLVGAIRHDNSTDTPNNCDYVREAWATSTNPARPWQGLWTNGGLPLNGFVYGNGSLNLMLPPNNSLFGTADIINVANAVQRAYDATALQDVYTTALHSRSGTVYPDIGGTYFNDAVVGSYANANDSTATGQQYIVAEVANAAAANLATANVNAGTTDSWVKSRVFAFDTYPVAGDTAQVRAGKAGWATVRAITAALQVSQVSNVFNAETGLGGTTDWIVTFPTKHEFLNAVTTNTTGTSGKIGYSVLGPTYSPAISGYSYTAPFNTGFNVPYAMTVYNREENEHLSAAVFSPSGAADTLPYETNVLSFGGNSVLNSSYGASITTGGFESGWAQLSFTDSSNTPATYGNFEMCEDEIYARLSSNQAAATRSVLHAGTNAAGTGVKCITGLPVVGFSTAQIYNNVSSNKSYSTLFAHKFGRTISL